MTSGGTGDFYGQYVDGVYRPVQATDEGAISGGTGGGYYVNEETIANAGYDYACVSYIDSYPGDPQIGEAEVVNRADDYPVRFGERSLKLDYSIYGQPDRANTGICFGFADEINLGDLGNRLVLVCGCMFPKIRRTYGCDCATATVAATPLRWILQRRKFGNRIILRIMPMMAGTISRRISASCRRL